MSEPVIEAIDLIKFLGEGAGRVQALKSVSLTISGGELVLLMGPSGCGKTTLLSVVGCMLTPTHGTVRVVGRPTAALRPDALAAIRRQHVGFVFQSYHLFPTLCALDNVRLALDVRGERRRRAVANAKKALDTVGLSHKYDAYPRQLSGGEQQRVAIARAIVGDASIILADEPTGALDGANGQAVMTVLAQIAKDARRGVLVVTHDPRIVPFATRILHMDDGRIVGEDKPQPQPTPLAQAPQLLEVSK